MSKAPIRVAIVDDEVSVRTALARLLSASSFEPKTYGSAREFIDSIRNDIPECLVVDVHMPDFTGLDLQRYLNSINKKIPTVVITALDFDEIIQALFDRQLGQRHGPGALQQELRGGPVVVPFRDEGLVRVRPVG